MESGFSLGSNLGDRLVNLRTARRRLAALPGVRELAVAPIYETEPVGVQPEFRHLAFLNTVIILDGPFSPQEWRKRTAQIEDELGRVRAADKFAPRTLDIDVLYVGEHCVDEGGLTIPHPRWTQRRFVLQPLADVRPNLMLPDSDRTVLQLLVAFPPGASVTRFPASW